MFISIFNIAYKSFNIGKDLKNLEAQFRDNIENFEIIKKRETDLGLIIYIGESTSALHSSLYGYPFETSKWLKSRSKDKKFITFKNVFANHTHTTPSLQSSLSICTKKNYKECSLIDSNENYLSITDIVKKSNIESHLYSTQGSLGGHNFATKLVLNTDNKIFSYKEKIDSFLGNRFTPKIKDKSFFKKNFCDQNNTFKKDKSDLVFLHSYAGHGLYDGYASYIEDDVKFNYPKYINKKNFLGKDSSNFRLVYEYDKSMKYVDETLKEVVECSFNKTKETGKPLIFIYFADHGESPASAKGHDSSRLNYEMIHVPFVVYFNDIALSKYEDKFRYLQSLKDKKISLRTLSEIILFLFEINISSKSKNFDHRYDSFKTLNTSFILERKGLDGKIKKINTYWNKDSKLNKDDNNEFKNLDVSIKLWQMNNYLETSKKKKQKSIENLVCQHRANSFIMQYKASMSIGCFETDVYFFKDKVLSTHNLEKDTNLIFDNFFETKYGKNTVWLDAKNIYEIEACNYSSTWLANNYQKFESLLLEIPTKSKENINNLKWIECINKIKNIPNVEITYYMDTKLIKDCSNDIKKRNINSNNCKNLVSQTELIMKKFKINSISFDFNAGYTAIKNQPSFKNYKWHTWHVDDISEVQQLIAEENLGIILLKNNKNLSNIN